MMLVHKHPVLPLSPSLVHAHRRNPSAPPTVIVQPTRTPGLLSLSKPPRPSPNHNRQLHAQQRHQKAASRPRLQNSVVVDKHVPILPLPATPTPTPSPQVRGRAHAKQTKEKTNAISKTLLRSASHNSLRGSRSARQPSPPTLPQAKTPQAEGPFVLHSQTANPFDPFLDDASSHKPPPTLTSKPSGKLARRRQPQAGAVPPSPSPASSKAIPVPPITTRTHAHNLSRSDPALSHMPKEQQRRRSSTAGGITFDVFPICDDMTDAGDLSDHEPPVTPTRPKVQNKFNTSPRTAPVTGFFPSFPSAPSSAPQHKGRQGGRKHKRSPSEGVFNMSSDDDSSSGLNPSVSTFFQLSKTPGAGKKVPLPAYSSSFRTSLPLTPKFARDLAPTDAQAKERQFEKEAAEKVAGYFASSSFQNSPSPEELPDPLFI